MVKMWIAACGIAGMACLGTAPAAVAASKGAAARNHAAAVSDVSSQARLRRSRTRIVVYPRIEDYPGYYPGHSGVIGPRHFGFSPYPRSYEYDWPGPFAKRDCVAWLAAQARPSGPVVVPHRRCWWTPG